MINVLMSDKYNQCNDSFCKYYFPTEIGPHAQYQDKIEKNGFCLRNFCIYNIPQHKRNPFSSPYMMKL